MRPEWKEMVHHIEGEQRMTFDGGSGVTPHALYVPDAATWNLVVPDWLVVRLLRAYSGDDVVGTSTGYPHLR